MRLFSILGIGTLMVLSGLTVSLEAEAGPLCRLLNRAQSRHGATSSYSCNSQQPSSRTSRAASSWGARRGRSCVQSQAKSSCGSSSYYKSSDLASLRYIQYTYNQYGQAMTVATYSDGQVKKYWNWGAPSYIKKQASSVAKKKTDRTKLDTNPSRKNDRTILDENPARKDGTELKNNPKRPESKTELLPNPPRN